MTLSASCGALILLASLALSGCAPSAQSQLDDEKEPHFLAGKNRVSTMDYQGAIECFEKALAVNPQSAMAHFELACLFDQKEANPADAIYHYEHYLQLRPRAGNADIVNQRILACKQALAQTVSLGPITEKVQREFEQLTDANKKLTEENKRLQDELEKLRAAANTQPSLTSPIRPAANPPRAPPAVAANVAATSRPLATSSTFAHTHTVKAGETPLLIAREYGVKLDALMAANPRLDPRRLRVGQALSIPVQ
jgi:LysM repeat protein